MRGRAFSRIGAMALTVFLSACASAPTLSTPDLVGSHEAPGAAKGTKNALAAPSDTASLPNEPNDAYDPLEKMNRSTLELNQRFDHSVIYPLATAYSNTVPQPVRNSLKNFVSNLAEPMVFTNDVLQLRLNAAATTAGRFAVNSTIGVAGIADVATRQNLPQQSGDFGQTLYVWGIRKSPYIVVPFIGPTNLRDLFGTTVELAATLPAGYMLPAQVASAANNVTVVGTVASPFTLLDRADDMKQLEESSLDFYAMLRSVADQKRQAELQQALQESGWTSARFGSSVAAVPPAAIGPFDQGPLPRTPNQEFMADAFPDTHERQ
jgi:phospholipid-binding lipoprotein MlaA